MGFLDGSSLQLSLFPSFSLITNYKNHSGRSTIVKNCVKPRRNEHHVDNGEGGESVFFSRRAVLFVGLSAIPFIQPRADAVEGPLVNAMYNANGSAVTRAVGRRPQVFGSRAEGRQTPNPINLDGKEESVPSVSLPQKPDTEEDGTLQISTPQQSGTKEDSVPQVSVSQDPDVASKLSQDIPEEKLDQQENQPNTSFSALNGLGIIGSGVLGALYTLVQKDKRTIESRVETLKRNLNEKEAAMSLLKDSLEKKVLAEQEERIKAIRKSKEEQLSLSEQVASAGRTILSMQQELQQEKGSSQELKSKLENILISLEQAGKDKVVLESNLKEKQDLVDVLNEKIYLLTAEVNEKSIDIDNMKLSLAEKEQGYEQLLSVSGQAEKSLEEANSEIQGLREELAKSRMQLDTTRSELDDLDNKVGMAVEERNDLSEKLSAVEEEYNAFKSSSKEKAARDCELLSEKERHIQDLKQTLEKHVHEATEHDALVKDLSQQRDDLMAMLHEREHELKNLQSELPKSQANLQASILERDNLVKDVENFKKARQDLASEMSRIQSKFSEVQGSFQRKLEEEQSTSKALSNELKSAEENLLKSKEEVKHLHDELKLIQGVRENLEKELLEIYKKAEGNAHDLKEERNLVTSLKREVEALRKQISEDKEARQNVERDLEEAANALDEMNKNALLLSKEVEMFRSRADSLEAEKKLLCESLHEQKLLLKEAQENAEHTHSVLVRFGKEKEQLAKRANKLEEELASMKGEVLRLRRQISSAGSRVQEGHTLKNSETELEDSASVKKLARKKKAGRTIEVPQ